MGDSSASHTEWSPTENKLFENALAIFSDDAPDRWINVAKMVPSKTPNEVAQHYLSLVEDVEFIESGLIAIPRYVDDEDENEDEEISKEEEEEEEVVEHEEEEEEEKNKEKEKKTEIKVEKNKRLSSEATPSKQQRRRCKVIPWNEQEHRLFLMGLNKYGRGDWRSISRNYVMTRTPAQVASHAQKYFKRMNNAATRGNRRPSIHDIRAIGVPETRFSINNVHAPIYDPTLLSDISYNPTAGGPMIRASNLPMLPKPFVYGNIGSFGNFQPNNLMGLRENPNYQSNSIMDSMGNPSYPSNNMMDTMGNPNFQSNNLMEMTGNCKNLMSMIGNSNDSTNVMGNYPPNFPRTSNIDPSGSSSYDYTEYPPL